jgi:uncharacterized membrane protein
MSTAVALAVHILGAVIWVGGMFAILCLPAPRARHARSAATPAADDNRADLLVQ